MPKLDSPTACLNLLKAIVFMTHLLFSHIWAGNDVTVSILLFARLWLHLFSDSPNVSRYSFSKILLIVAHITMFKLLFGYITFGTFGFISVTILIIARNVAVNKTYGFWNRAESVDDEYMIAFYSYIHRNSLTKCLFFGKHHNISTQRMGTDNVILTVIIWFNRSTFPWKCSPQWICNRF